MKFSKSIYLSFLLLLIFATLVGFAGIRGFSRLAPSIEQINRHNTQSLYIAEKMLSSIAIEKNENEFQNALKLAKNNITEKGEKEALDKIEQNYKKAFEGDNFKEEQTVKGIIELSKINRIAMKNAALEAERLSSAGFWVIIFMIFIIWGLGIVIVNNIKKNIIDPMLEIKDVFECYEKGNRLRRCSKAISSKEFQNVCENINNLLDKAD